MNRSYRKAYLRLFGFSRLGRVGDVTTVKEAERTRQDLQVEKTTVVTHVNEQNN